MPFATSTPPIPVIGVVPARAGSKGLPGKNLAPFLGAPLYRRAVSVGFEAGLDEIVVTTDIAEILAAPPEPRLRVARRPSALAGDATPMADVLADLLDREIRGAATIVLLQPTSPLRTAAHVQATLARFAEGDASLALTATRTDNGVLKSGLVVDGFLRAVRRNADLFSNRQSLPPLYRPNGAVYAFAADAFRAAAGFPSDAVAVVEMSAEESVDIDTYKDLCDAEARLRKAGRSA